MERSPPGVQQPSPWEFSRQAYWSGLPFPSLGDLPDLGIEPRVSSALKAFSLLSEPPGKHFRHKGHLQLLPGKANLSLQWGAVLYLVEIK